MSKYDIHCDHCEDKRDGHHGSSDQLGVKPLKAHAWQRNAEGEDINGNYDLAGQQQEGSLTRCGDKKPRRLQEGCTILKAFLCALTLKWECGHHMTACVQSGHPTPINVRTPQSGALGEPLRLETRAGRPHLESM